jgi:hypothetical protein
MTGSFQPTFLSGQHATKFNLSAGFAGNPIQF